MIQNKNQIGGGRCNQDLQLLIKHPNFMGNVHCVHLLQLSSSVFRERTRLKCIFKAPEVTIALPRRAHFSRESEKHLELLAAFIFHQPQSREQFWPWHHWMCTAHLKPGTSKHQERENFVFVQNGRIGKKKIKKM